MASEDTQPIKIIAPPPALYLGTLIFGFAVDAIWPLEIPASYPLLIGLGVLIFVVSAVCVRWAFSTMREKGTSPNPYKASEALVNHGPFQHSRNPIYVAMTCSISVSIL